MRCVIAAFLVVAGVLVLRGPGLTADSTPEQTSQRVEATFRSAMAAWAYEEYWRLWEMGTGPSRSALPRQEFTDRMRRGNTQLAAGKQVEEIQVTSNSPESALLYVRFGLEDKRRVLTESVERPFLLRLEEGQWKVSLWDFIGLANFFPPDFVLTPPLLVPPPATPRLRRVPR
ncbi:MAG TPA: hypothetical protein VLT62_18815 [Candidatus Methylomirabilis sp.]|nr:hypothetical protein [Candidatus Methylomirabilis sp.]